MSVECSVTKGESLPQGLGTVVTEGLGRVQEAEVGSGTSQCFLGTTELPHS